MQGLLIPPHHTLLDWEDFDWTRFSVIRFGLSVQNPDSNLVSADHFRSVNLAMERIHERGYRRIGLTVNEEFNQRLGGNYLGGFCNAQLKLKLRPAIPALLTAFGTRALGLPPTTVKPAHREQLRRWLVKYRPDAVLTADIEIPGLLRGLGYRIPQDIAVAATSVRDIPVDAGIDQHSEAIGRIAVEMLVKQLHVNERGAPSDPCRILVESRWQDGQSLPPRKPAR